MWTRIEQAQLKVHSKLFVKQSIPTYSTDSLQSRLVEFPSYVSVLILMLGAQYGATNNGY